MAGKWNVICRRKSEAIPRVKVLFFTKKNRLTEIMRPYAGDNREVDGFARRHGVFGFNPAIEVMPK
ncbi:hypothetical protein FS595_09340 [Serratia rubidaea]|nr:hypothetical protein FS596_09340 [Serratia rubidaea]UJD84446.1 hypothetical protein FS595_09340 [Serratia rubidaea]